MTELFPENIDMRGRTRIDLLIGFVGLLICGTTTYSAIVWPNIPSASISVGLATGAALTFVATPFFAIFQTSTLKAAGIAAVFFVLFFSIQYAYGVAHEKTIDNLRFNLDDKSKNLDIKTNELRSINENLFTVTRNLNISNAELDSKIKELTSAIVELNQTKQELEATRRHLAAAIQARDDAAVRNAQLVSAWEKSTPKIDESLANLGIAGGDAESIGGLIAEIFKKEDELAPDSGNRNFAYRSARGRFIDVQPDNSPNIRDLVNRLSKSINSSTTEAREALLEARTVFSISR